MITIKKFIDLGKFQQRTQKYLREYVQHLFFHLHKVLDPKIPTHLFDLSEHGYIVVLEPEDDIRDLTEIGLSAENDGLLGTVPEAVTAKKLKDGRIFYQVETIFNNEFLLYVLLFEEDVDSEIQKWLQTFCDEEVIFT